METRKIVLQLLKKYPKTRSSDKELLLKYMYVHWDVFSMREFIENHFSFIQNFIRYRAKIQAEWLYPASKKVRAYREKMREAKKKEFINDFQERKIRKDEVISITLKKKWSKPLKVTEVWKLPKNWGKVNGKVF